MKRTRTSSALAGALAALIALAGCSAGSGTTPTGSADALTQLQASGVLKVGTEGTYSPFTFHDPTTNQLTGFDIEVITAVAEKLGVKPEECLCVGDSPFDLQSGRSAGAKTVAVRYTAFGWEKLLEEGRPDFVIASPQELLEIVGKAK